MSQTSGRLLGADFVRASACFIVLFHHLAQRIDFRSELGAHSAAQVFNSVGGFGVGMFFVLSGFLLSRPFWMALDAQGALPSLQIYALRRTARIVPGFWLALTVTFLLSFTLFGAQLDGWLWLRYVSGLLLVSDWHWTTLFPVEVNGPLWSIGFEVTSYALLPLGFVALFLGLRGKVPRWATRVGWLGVVVAALLAHWLFYENVRVDPFQKGWQFGLQGGAKTWMPWFNPFSFFAMFAVGALAGGVQVLVTRYRSWVFDVVTLAALIAAGVLVWGKGLEGGGEFYGWWRVPYQFPLFHLLIALALASGPSTKLLGNVLDNPLVGYLAQISFGIYVWHYLVLELVRLIWVPEMTNGSMSDTTTFLVASLVVIAISICVAALSYRWLEEPVMRWARTLERPA